MDGYSNITKGLKISRGKAAAKARKGKPKKKVAKNIAGKPCGMGGY